MKCRLLSTAVLSLVCCSLLVFGQSPQWKGTIESENGIKVVKNPGEPFHGKIEWKLEEDLSLGNETDDKYMFYFPMEAAVDSQENIFVLVAKEFEIRKFDKNGEFLGSVGRRGEGPGEFVQPIRLHLDSQGRVYVYDSLRRTLHVFSNDLILIEARKLDFILSGYGFARDDHVILETISGLREVASREIILVRPSGELIDTLASFPYERTPMVKNHILNNPYSHKLYFASFYKGGTVYGYSSEYVLHVVSDIGKPSFKIMVDRDPDPIREREKKKLLDEYLERQDKRMKAVRIAGMEKLTRADLKKGYEFPEHKPFFTGILVDDKNRIYVRKLKLYDPDERSLDFEFFNEEGIYLYDITMPFYPRAIANNRLYRTEHDRDTGYSVIKRYQITNWGSVDHKYPADLAETRVHDIR